MEIRFHNSAKEVSTMTTGELRSSFLIESLMQADELKLVYTHYDRMIIGGTMPVSKTVTLPTYDTLKAKFFLERRELGIINVGGDGEVKVNGKVYDLSKLTCLYVGKGNEKISFKSKKKDNPAKFYLLSAPAHHVYPTKLMTKEKAMPVEMGAVATANQRTIYKYIHLAGIKSCQLVMGLTILKEGSVWNTMPTHVHDRRMEAYFYFDVPANQKVIHLMGDPAATKHLVVSNDEAIISPPWSIHSGCGTSNYGFIWGMGGENQDYADMDAVDINKLK
ncbi:MAG TPA: 5-dehydro-4-deoxy-D-glucuronate isomerase [Ferruginibacter sp.]|nr:5-dehydro-4-deoxy-D-glucuronate isomerase [Ferruginibacter sp.]